MFYSKLCAFLKLMFFVLLLLLVHYFVCGMAKNHNKLKQIHKITESLYTNYILASKHCWYFKSNRIGNEKKRIKNGQSLGREIVYEKKKTATIMAIITKAKIKPKAY